MDQLKGTPKQLQTTYSNLRHGATQHETSKTAAYLARVGQKHKEEVKPTIR
jgi:hypothetical protein